MVAVLNIVLVEPEIPPNTGNVSRLCAGLDAALHLVEPLGFSISDRHLKRAGLDYWQHVRLHLHPNFPALQHAQPAARFVYTTAHAHTLHTEWTFEPGDFLVFGKETSGLPAELLAGREASTIRIPHWGPVRSLNLSNAVAVIAYEAMRQFQVRGLVPPPVPRLPDRLATEPSSQP